MKMQSSYSRKASVENSKLKRRTLIFRTKIDSHAFNLCQSDYRQLYSRFIYYYRTFNAPQIFHSHTYELKYFTSICKFKVNVIKEEKKVFHFAKSLFINIDFVVGQNGRKHEICCIPSSIITHGYVKFLETHSQ